MRPALSPLCFVALPLLLAAGCGAEGVTDTPVRATLDDGQVIMGSVWTETLQLETGFGTIDIPIEDIGEVQPVEGGALGGSGNHVSVWLRNGSELRGEWAEPELQMGLQIDQQTVSVDLPMHQLERFQLQGGDLLQAGLVYRVRTIYGDDFVVDAEETWLTLDNHLGSFSPTLAEVLSLEPADDSSLEEATSWRMALSSGTVLIGPLSGTGETAAALSLALPLGPGDVSVAIDDIVSIERQDWGQYDSYMPTDLRDSGAPQPAAEQIGDWFDNRRQSRFKETF